MPRKKSKDPISTSLVKRGQFRSFAELRGIFASVDQVGGLTVFNIGGNKARLVAAILTHSEYDQGKWKE